METKPEASYRMSAVVLSAAVAAIATFDPDPAFRILR
jgi:hypothetical protein